MSTYQPHIAFAHKTREEQGPPNPPPLPLSPQQKKEREPMGKPADPYEVLGLRKEDKPGSDVIRKAYHRLARVHHPDKARTPEDREAAEARFKEIGSAYETLSDPEKREKYDANGFEKEWMNPREAEVRRTRTGAGEGEGMRTSRSRRVSSWKAHVLFPRFLYHIFFSAGPRPIALIVSFFSPTPPKTRRVERAREGTRPNSGKDPDSTVHESYDATSRRERHRNGGAFERHQKHDGSSNATHEPHHHESIEVQHRDGETTRKKNWGKL